MLAHLLVLQPPHHGCTQSRNDGIGRSLRRHQSVPAGHDEILQAEFGKRLQARQVEPVSAAGVTETDHAILVDQSGVRYMREAVSYMEICQNMFARNEQVPAIPSWLIFDSVYIEKYMIAGTMPGANKPQAWFDKGFFRKADTITDLARTCDIDPAALTATVDLVRLDHFIGFVRYWEVPPDAPDARPGQWRPGPGRALFDALAANLAIVRQGKSDKDTAVAIAWVMHLVGDLHQPLHAGQVEGLARVRLLGNEQQVLRLGAELRAVRRQAVGRDERREVKALLVR